MSKKKVKKQRLTPKSKADKAPAKTTEEIGIPLVSKLQTRAPVIVAAGKSWRIQPQ